MNSTTLRTTIRDELENARLALQKADRAFAQLEVLLEIESNVVPPIQMPLPSQPTRVLKPVSTQEDEPYPEVNLVQEEQRPPVVRLIEPTKNGWFDLAPGIEIEENEEFEL